MKNENILLTIGLPVYNGEKCIGLTLESILNALKCVQKKELVEILVSDNMSVDETLKIIQQYINKGLKIKYYCNENNIGYDKNIDNIVKKAQGKYVWFLGCGEKVKKNSLVRLIEKLNNNIEYTNILLDFDIYEEAKNKITNKRIYDFDKDILIIGKNDFQYVKYSPAVSANIINKDKWLKVSNEKLEVNGWCHIERILSMIALDDNSKTLLLPYPYFTLYREKNGWWTKPNSYLLLLLHIKVIDSMIKKGFSKKVVNQLKRKQSRFSLIIAILQSKKYGLKVNKKILRDMIKTFKKDCFFWLIAFPLLVLPRKMDFIPNIIIRILIFIKKVCKNVKKNLF